LQLFLPSSLIEYDVFREMGHLGCKNYTKDGGSKFSQKEHVFQMGEESFFNIFCKK